MLKPLLCRLNISHRHLSKTFSPPKIRTIKHLSPRGSAGVYHANITARGESMFPSERDTQACWAASRRSCLLAHPLRHCRPWRSWGSAFLKSPPTSGRPPLKNKKSAQRGSFWDGHPADIRGSFARISRPKNSVRAVKILEKQAFRRGHPWPEGADVHGLKGFPKTQKSLGVHKILVRKIWFPHPPGKRAQNEEKLFKSVENPQNWHFFRGGTQVYGQNDFMDIRAFLKNFGQKNFGLNFRSLSPHAKSLLESSAVPERGRSKHGRRRRNTQMSVNERKISAKERKRKVHKRAQKGANERKRALPRKNCKQPGLKQQAWELPIDFCLPVI